MNVVIIGGVATGPRTAARLRRLLPLANITLVNDGKRLSYGACGLPYFTSGDISDVSELFKTSFGVIRDENYFRDVKGFETMAPYRAERINREERVVYLKGLETGESVILEYDRLIIATGARPIRLNLPGIDNERVRTFSRPDDAVHYRKLAETGQIGAVCIIGAGFIGCELSESFGALWGIDAKVIERESHVLPSILDPEMAELVHAEMRANGIELRLGATVSRFEEGDDCVEVICDDKSFEVDQAVMAVGFQPNSELAAEAGLKIGETGGIFVDEYLKTSDENIFAGGDCVENRHIVLDKGAFLPLGSIANRHGRLIANNIAGRRDKFPGVTGALVVKVFDINVAATGVTEKCAKDNGIDAVSVWGSFLDKAEYYPEWKYVYCKMVYENDSGRLLGLQAVGPGDVTRRVDLFSQLLLRNATLEDLIDIEAAYSPPYSTALDPLYVLGCIALNQREDDIRAVIPTNLDNGSLPKNTAVIDVREDEERESEPLRIEGCDVIEVPLGNLRAGLPELDADKKALVVCHRGVRGYEGARILKNAGFKDPSFLAGGVSFLNAMKREDK